LDGIRMPGLRYPVPVQEADPLEALGKQLSLDGSKHPDEHRAGNSQTRHASGESLETVGEWRKNKKGVRLESTRCRGEVVRLPSERDRDRKIARKGGYLRPREVGIVDRFHFVTSLDE
jgi:hypothetical protein